MPSSVPAVKRGLRIYLASWQGLRPGDGVTVRSAPAGGDLPNDTVELGDVAAPQTRAGLTSKAENATMTCWCQSTAAGTGEDAIDAARTRAYELLALVEAALKADPTASGTVAPPRGTMTVSDSTLIESASDHEGSGGRRAQIRFTISWTSHI